MHTFEHQCADLSLPWFSFQHHGACCGEGTKSWLSPLMTPQNASSQGTDAVDLVAAILLFFVNNFRKEFGKLAKPTPPKKWGRSILVGPLSAQIYANPLFVFRVPTV